MRKLFSSLLFILCISNILSHAQTISIQYDNSYPQVNYAATRLKQSLQEKHFTIQSGKTDYTIILSIETKNGIKESYSITPGKNKITIHGGDATGVLYGSLALLENLRNGTLLSNIKPSRDTPMLVFRAIKYDLPWDTYRHSYALTQHQEVCKSVEYWEAFLNMMVENRLNVLTLWNLHPYPYLIKSKKFPEASPFTDKEMVEWKNLFGSIFSMAKERGIDTYIIPFNIFVTPEFAKAHQTSLDNLEHHHFVNGDTSEIVKEYTRESVAQMLQEYPDLSGMGLTLGEAMGGMTPQRREDWMKETIIEGMRMAGRKSKLIHRIPFSGNTASLGATSIEMEQITRKGIEQEAAMDFIEGPVWADLKFNWSHAHSTPKLIKVHGGKLYGTYFDPVPHDYKVTWTARNEDFFCLRWGVPGFVREHIKQNTHPYVGGYFIGSETYIPAKDYFTKPGTPVSWKYAFERQWLFYKIWGRLLYSSATPDELFRKEFTYRYGEDGDRLFTASSLAGKTPLRLGYSFDFTWDFTLYSEGFMALNQKDHREEFISVDWMINQPPLDPEYISIKEYVEVLNTGKKIETKNRVTPFMLADSLEKDCRKALELLKPVKVSSPTLEQEVADIKVWANLGLYFAEKIRGGVALQTFRTTGGEKNKTKAIGHLKKALTYWDEVIAITEPLYLEMPLVHFSEQDNKPWQENDHLRFHWKNLRPDVVKDIEIAEKSVYR